MLANGIDAGVTCAGSANNSRQTLAETFVFPFRIVHPNGIDRRRFVRVWIRCILFESRLGQQIAHRIIVPGEEIGNLRDGLAEQFEILDNTIENDQRGASVTAGATIASSNLVA